MNGPFAWLFKLLLATYPPFLAAMIAWGSWVTANIMKLEAQASLGPRFTAEHGVAMETRITAQTDQKLSVLAKVISEDLAVIRLAVQGLPKETPPKWWEDYVREKLRDIEIRVNKLENEKVER